MYSFALTTKLGRLLYKLKTPDHCYIVYSNNIDHYLKLLLHDKPSHILGLGSYSGIDQDKIRIETITINRFRNHKIAENAPEQIELTNFLISSNKNFKLATALGNSWCNLISWKIMRLIENGSLSSKYSFLHIPKGFNLNSASQKIENILSP